MLFAALMKDEASVDEAERDLGHRVVCPPPSGASVMDCFVSCGGVCFFVASLTSNVLHG